MVVAPSRVHSSVQSFVAVEVLVVITVSSILCGRFRGGHLGRSRLHRGRLRHASLRGACLRQHVMSAVVFALPWFPLLLRRGRLL